MNALVKSSTGTVTPGYDVFNGAAIWLYISGRGLVNGS